MVLYVQSNPFLVCRVVSSRHLPQARYPRPQVKVGIDVLTVAFQFGCRDRTGANKAHFSDKDIPNLGKLIQAGHPDKMAKSGDPRVKRQLLVVRPLRRGFGICRKVVNKPCFGVGDH